VTLQRVTAAEASLEPAAAAAAAVKARLHSQGSPGSACTQSSPGKHNKDITGALTLAGLLLRPQFQTNAAPR
jgi:hypothetical protein